ncbi:MAG: DUF2726 domain-containing protein [Oscillospiraceae bacterium]|nr:DUF2726 domain-containing protein [Oscillospiraceae bacterium]
MPEEQKYLYEVKKSLITSTERSYLRAIKKSLPEGYIVLPQVSLRSVLIRTDNAKFQNELFRIADGLICRIEDYHPVAVVEINDASHLQSDRKNRDTKVKNICEEAGLPIITLWTSYGINEEYIKKRVQKAIEESMNPRRVKHSESVTDASQQADFENEPMDVFGSNISSNSNNGRNNPKAYSKANTVLKYVLVALIIICIIAIVMRS